MAAKIEFTSTADDNALRGLERTIMAMLGYSERNEGLVKVEKLDMVHDYVLVLAFPLTKQAEEAIYLVMRSHEFEVQWTELNEEYRGW